MLKLLDYLEEAIITILMAAATLIVFVAVVHRYALGVSFLHDFMSGFSTSWAQELCIYLFIWMAKFGAAYGVRTGIHVGVDVLVNRLEERLKHKVVIFGLMSGAAFTGIIGTLGAHFVLLMSRTDQISPDMELPMWIIYLCIPLGSYLMCFRFVQVAFAYQKTGRLPHVDHAHVAGIESEEAKA